MIDERERKVLDLIEANRQEVIDFLRELLAFKTITPDAQRVEHDEFIRHQAFMKQTLTDLGFPGDRRLGSRCRQARRSAGLRRRQDVATSATCRSSSDDFRALGEGRSLILNGHYDVVPLGLARKLDAHDPFAGRSRGRQDLRPRNQRHEGRDRRDVEGARVHRARGLCARGRHPRADRSRRRSQLYGNSGRLSAGLHGRRRDHPRTHEHAGGHRGARLDGRAGYRVRTRGARRTAPAPLGQEGGAVNAISKAMRVLEGMADATEQWRTQPDKQHPLVPPDHIIPTVIHGGEWSVTIPEKVEIEFDCMFVPGTNDKRSRDRRKARRRGRQRPLARARTLPNSISAGPKSRIYPAEVRERRAHRPDRAAGIGRRRYPARADGLWFPDGLRPSHQLLPDSNDQSGHRHRVGAFG